MSAAIKARILRDVKRRVQAGTTYICFALDDIEAHDHRRIVKNLIDDIRADVKARLAPHKTVGDWFAGMTGGPANMAELQQARVTMIDAMLLTLDLAAH